MSDISSNSSVGPEGGPVIPPVQEAAMAVALPGGAGELPPRTPAQQRTTVRIWCTFVFSLCVGMLGVALWLTPSTTGVETHRELGLPPCGFFLATGIPCPTCGCTTSVTYFAHGHWMASFLTHPFGFAVAVLAVVLTPLTAVGMLTGKWLGPSMFTLGWYWRSWVYGTIAILVVGWVYKIYIIKAGIHLP